MLVAIMWEESTFCNIREIKKNGEYGPACGFGQVNDTEYWRFKNEFGTANEIRNRVLSNKAFSVKLVSLMLANMHSILKDRDAVLRGYAGIGTPGADQHNEDGYNHWLAAERVLLEALADPQKCYVGYWGDAIPLRPYVEKALRAAKPNSVGFIDQAVRNMPVTRPEGDAPGWLKDAVQSYKA
ncbi:MAG: hypothetical protein NT090_14725 [Acidobacteria bacterium]|nr:hypothetical protein [Acidobacteriota bacterium]